MEEKSHNTDEISLYDNIKEKIEVNSKNEILEENKDSNKNTIKFFFNELISSNFEKYAELFDNFEKKKFYFSHIQKIFEVLILINF
jgi:hypothetical protein